jgi:hypothetical protein
MQPLWRLACKSRGVMNESDPKLPPPDPDPDQRQPEPHEMPDPPEPAPDVNDPIEPQPMRL